MVGIESLPNVREWLRASFRFAGVVGRPSGMSGSGQEALLHIRSDKETLLDFREWSGGTRGFP